MGGGLGGGGGSGRWEVGADGLGGIDGGEGLGSGALREDAGGGLGGDGGVVRWEARAGEVSGGAGGLGGSGGLDTWDLLWSVFCAVHCMWWGEDCRRTAQDGISETPTAAPKEARAMVTRATEYFILTVGGYMQTLKRVNEL